MTAAGRLVLVVGPSGAGKDTLLAGARAALAGSPDYVFPRREITRPADAGGEDHIAVAPADFEAARRADGYALSWKAHGLCYGVPRAVEADLARGATVIVNVSRTVIDAARAAYPGSQVIVVTAPADVLAARLAARGREPAAGLQARLGRAVADPAVAPGVWRIWNTRSAGEGVAEFLFVLDKIHRGAGTAASAPRQPVKV